VGQALSDRRGHVATLDTLRARLRATRWARHVLGLRWKTHLVQPYVRTQTEISAFDRAPLDQAPNGLGSSPAGAWYALVTPQRLLRNWWQPPADTDLPCPLPGLSAPE